MGLPHPEFTELDPCQIINIRYLMALKKIRGVFEFQGQKCSACSRLYVPASLWPAVQDQLKEKIAEIQVGSVTDFTNFVNVVIDEKFFDNIDAYISRAQESSDAEVIIGGQRDKSKGYFVHPTVIQAKTPDYESMAEEIFGPVLFLPGSAKWSMH